MTGALDDGERTMLRDRARQRLTRRMWLSAIVVSVAVAVPVILGGLLVGSEVSTGSWVLIGGGAGLLIAGLLVLAWQFGRRRIDPPLVEGSDPATRRAVRRALRDGHTDDPRVDELAHDLIARNLPAGWVPLFCAGLAVLSLMMLLLGDRDPGDIARTVVTVPLAGIAGYQSWRQRRRMQDYRGLSGGGRPTG
ncbi:hypothetical protein [Plantactinospora sp. CA-290183]|uniref:hypothetical protein n=1 Tax=Plantactinospora sp. CA-290183 TaxID=3240006 RepID=UPI003D8B0D41